MILPGLEFEHIREAVQHINSYKALTSNNINIHLCSQHLQINETSMTFSQPRQLSQILYIAHHVITECPNVPPYLSAVRF